MNKATRLSRANNHKATKGRSKDDGFIKWLRKQAVRPDMVGELSRYVTKCIALPGIRFRARTTRELIQSMAWYDTPSRMFSILDIAHTEFIKGVGWDEMEDV